MMQRRVEMLIKKKILSSGAKVALASLFGSFRRGDFDEFSDIDVLIVYEEREDASRISQRLKYLEEKLFRPIHINLFSIKEFEERMNLHDYLLASVIEDSSFILGRKDLFLDAKQKILESNLNEESILFNRKMGVSILNNVYSSFDEISRYDRNTYFNVMKGLNDYRLALGYIYASMQMQRLGKSISKRRLMRTEFGLPLREIARLERNIKRGITINRATIHGLVDEVKNRSLRILEEKCYPSGRISLLSKD